MSQQGQQNPENTIKNLQFACNELEHQNNMLRNRAVELGIQMGQIREYAQLLEARVKQFEEAMGAVPAEVREAVAEAEPVEPKTARAKTARKVETVQ